MRLRIVYDFLLLFGWYTTFDSTYLIEIKSMNYYIAGADRIVQ